jgi:tetratricopeptide (TPR) repeat protein
MDTDLQIMMEKFEQNPGHAENTLKLCYALNIRSMHNKCEEIATHAAKYLPNDCDIEYERILAICLNENQELEHQAAIIDRLIEEGDGDPKLKRNLALIYFYLEQDDRALPLLEDLTPHVGHTPLDSRSYEVLAQIYLAREAYDQCIELCDLAIDAPGPSARAIRLKGLCYLEQLAYDQAIACFQTALQLEPHFVWACHSLGELCMEQGNYGEAFRFFGRATAINPIDPGNYFLLAEAFLDAEMMDIAIAEFKKILLLDIDHWVEAEVYNAMGFIYLKMNLLNDARFYLKKAQETEPSLAMIYYNLGRLAAKQNKIAQAEKHYRKAVMLDGGQSGAWLELGFLAVNQKKVNHLTPKYFQKALELEPHDPEPHLGLSKYYRLVNQPEDQLRSALRAFERDPDNGHICNNLGIAYECNHMDEDAILAYQEGLRVDPENSQAANNLGYLYERLMKEHPDQQELWKNRAIEAWKQRLTICYRLNKSTQGACNHLKQLGISDIAIQQFKRDTLVDRS